MRDTLKPKQQRKTLEIEAIYCREKLRFSDSNTSIIEIEPIESQDGITSRIETKIEVEQDTLTPGVSYRFFGWWSEYTNRRTGQSVRQFCANSYVVAKPHGRSGTMAYLQQAPHVGPAIAGKLWDEFGADAVRIARECPESVAGSGIMKLIPAKDVSEYLKSISAEESCRLELMELFESRGFPKTTIAKCLAEWGNCAAGMIQRNPFKLLRFPGCGFRRCDELYQALGKDPKRLKRQAYCLVWVLTQIQGGSTWHHRAQVESLFRGYVGYNANFTRALELAYRAKLVEIRKDQSGNFWISDYENAVHEQRVYVCVRGALSHEHSQWPDPDEMSVTEHQRAQLKQAFRGGNIAMLTGGPGTGKTYCVAQIVRQATARNGANTVAICAPTGKAAVRATQALAALGVSQRATTIHSLIGRFAAQAAMSEGNLCYLDLGLLVIDEASMVDLVLFSQLLEIVAPATKLLLVGDAQQLPPVGDGSPLRDLLNAGIFRGELTEVRRNSGRIVQACDEIRRTGQFSVSAKLDPDNGENLYLIDANTPEKIMEAVVDTLRKIDAAGVADPIWDCQVICATNTSGELSRQKLNDRLATLFRPASTGQLGDGTFRVGEKIVCTENSKFACVDCRPGTVIWDTTGETITVANGEQGRIVEPGKKSNLVEFDGSPGVTCRVPGASADDGGGSSLLELAYAISCHKSQGSEWPIVLVVLDPANGARMVCSREWLFTAISRGKVATILIGKKATADGFLQHRAIMARKTFLAELITQKMPLFPLESRAELIGTNEPRRPMVPLEF